MVGRVSVNRNLRKEKKHNFLGTKTFTFDIKQQKGEPNSSDQPICGFQYPREQGGKLLI